MRTTVDLPPDVHQLATAIAASSGTTFSVAVTRLLRSAMAAPAASRITVDAETGFPLFSSGRPVTGDDVRAMDDEE